MDVKEKKNLTHRQLCFTSILSLLIDKDNYNYKAMFEYYTTVERLLYS